MASFTPRNYITGAKAGEDLSALTNDTKYIALQLDTDGDVITSAAGEQVCIGILQNAPENNKAAEIASAGGGSLAIAAGTIAAGNFLKTDANGHLLAMSAETANAVAVAMDSAVDNDVFEVLLLQAGTSVTVA